MYLVKAVSPLTEDSRNPFNLADTEEYGKHSQEWESRLASIGSDIFHPGAFSSEGVKEPDSSMDI